MSLRSKLSSLREYLTPINHNSNFVTTGEISPEEFVKAGDYLVYKFPTWQWGTDCPKNLQKSFLPPDKQYLVTRHVPSYQRASNYLTGEDKKDGNPEEEDEEEDEEGWVKSKKIHRVIDDDSYGTQINKSEEINDIDEFIDENAEEQEQEYDESEDHQLEDDDFDDLDIINDSKNNKLRRFDLYITYSTSYRVPKLYLVGFDSNGIPLLPQQMFEDINSDYKDKTATIENLPVAHNTTSVSIHPCKHSSVMKVLMKHSKLNKKNLQQKDDSLSNGLNKLSVNEKGTTKEENSQSHDNEEEDEEGIRVDHYLIIFLKFIASVTPGIEYDYTMDAL
ncbi:autophagy-related E2-like conjugation enzyme, putative [Candida dubliniensis CD36]|uniref:Autophagy-related protein 3 n=1 Tax=Candida dubliniensis (strain CD36 / ATCC MYA-646 / CBS 7987 / NCPF 3949 / NRRL Y-17841) TaxID=573826 RepID=B9W6N7_CANDC|nr:autophagy-related E2-like conjugation enzyme, putative [Candida dubliniensis CD36]CAX44342.1 autophagy-related E2-like conjugation enzyme, putative [Candida dubliniensis CD36]